MSHCKHQVFENVKIECTGVAKEMDELAQWLDKIHLGHLDSAIRGRGIQSLRLLKYADEKDFNELALKPFEKKVLMEELRKLKASLSQFHNPVVFRSNSVL